MFKLLRKRKKQKNGGGGQTFVEYTILIGTVLTLMMAATPGIKRHIQSMIKATSDHVGIQKDSDQIGGIYGHLVSSNTTTAQARTKRLKEWFGTRSHEYDDQVDTHYNVILNQGYRESPDFE